MILVLPLAFNGTFLRHQITVVVFFYFGDEDGLVPVDTVQRTGCIGREWARSVNTLGDSHGSVCQQGKARVRNKAWTGDCKRRDEILVEIHASKLLHIIRGGLDVGVTVLK